MEIISHLRSRDDIQHVQEDFEAWQKLAQGAVTRGVASFGLGARDAAIDAFANCMDSDISPEATELLEEMQWKVLVFMNSSLIQNQSSRFELTPLQSKSEDLNNEEGASPCSPTNDEVVRRSASRCGAEMDVENQNSILSVSCN